MTRRHSSAVISTKDFLPPPPTPALAKQASILPISARLPTLTCTLCVALICRPLYIGQKIGHQIMKAIIDRAQSLGLKRLFCLTFETGF
ncbi:MAG: GNAT family N-acetyltransferase, partial [Betaproteobacteria bacterium]|nr:GNAT family N-acetyltransferase [Betaproteobacteria bacterium]